MFLKEVSEATVDAVASLTSLFTVDRQMDGYPALVSATADPPTAPAPRIEDRLRPLTLC